MDHKGWYIYTNEYYTTIRDDGIMEFTVIWIELEDKVLSEGRRKTNTE